MLMYSNILTIFMLGFGIKKKLENEAMLENHNNSINQPVVQQAYKKAQTIKDNDNDFIEESREKLLQDNLKGSKVKTASQTR